MRSEGLTSFRAELARQWREMAPPARIMFWVLAVLQLPLLFLILNRLSVPFDVDSAAYFHMHIIERVRNGGPVYVPVGPGYSSGTYAPLYYWITAPLARLLGSSMVWPRLVSLVSAGLYALVVSAFIWRSTRHLLLSWAGACFVLARYAEGDWIWDVGSAGLHSALAVLGFFVLSLPRSLPRILAAAVLLSLCTLTKQTGLGYVAAATVLIAVGSWRHAAVFAAVCAALVGGVSLWQNAVTDGMFYKACVLFTVNHPWEVERFWNEVIFPDLLGHFGLLAMLTFVPLVLARKESFWPTLLRAEYVMCGAGILVTLIAQPKAGSGGPQALVGYAGLAVCGCIGLHELVQRLPDFVRPRVLALVIALQIIALQINAVTIYRYRLIDAADRRAYEEVARVFRAGRTCYLFYAWLPTQFGQPDTGLFGDESTMWKDGRVQYNEPPEINEPFRRQEFDFVILPGYVDRSDPTTQAILENYKGVRRLDAHPRGTRGGNTRWEKIVMQANRFFPPEPAPAATPPAAPVAAP